MAPSSLGVVDPTKAAKYPIILSDSLLGGTTTEIFTGMRYNHKPTLSSESAPANAQLKPAMPSNTDSYDLSFTDGGGKYDYAGTRVTNDNQYVLYFDRARKAFILDRVDSVFNMNLTRTPDETNPQALSEQYEQLDVTGKLASESKPGKTQDKGGKPDKTTANKAGASSKASAVSKGASASRRKQVETKKEPVELVLPGPASELAPPVTTPMAVKRSKANEDSASDEESDDDGGLLVEYPDGNPRAGGRVGSSHFSPAFPAQVQIRQFSDFVRESEDAEDADGESDGEVGGDDDEHELERELGAFQLPSPVNGSREQGWRGEEVEDEDNGADLEKELERQMEVSGGGDIDDLEAELEAEFMQDHGAEEESEVSEED